MKKNNKFKKDIINQFIIYFIDSIWKEIVKKNYKIMKTCPIEHTIYSVKRLSDNKVFTVGDNTNGGIIKSFDIWKCPKNTPGFKDTLQITVSKNDDWLELDKIKHIKKPLFTTKDGVNIFKRNNFISCVNRKTLTLDLVNIEYDQLARKYKLSDYLKFSTKEAAEEYILMNKPCLSMQDLKLTGCLNENQFNIIIELIKSKI